MSSSSELELVSARPAAPSKPASPLKRRSGRTRRAPRSKDDTAAPAAPYAVRQTDAGSTAIELLDSTDGLSGEGEDDDDERVLPSLDNVLQARRGAHGRTASAAELGKSASVAAELPAPKPARVVAIPTSSSAPTLSTRPSGDSAAGPSMTSGTGTATTSLRRSRTPADRAPTSTSTVPLPRAKPAPAATHSSSEEADSFFGMARASAAARGTKRVPAGARAPRGRVPGRASSGSLTPRPTSPAKGSRAVAVSSDSDDPAARRPSASRSHPLSDSSSDSDTNTAKSASASPVKGGLQLPDWARKSGPSAVGAALNPRMSGADRARLANGPGQNRKRRRIDEDSADEGAGKGKGKEREKDSLLFEREDDGDETDDSLEIALGGVGGGGAKKGEEKGKKRAALSDSSDDDLLPSLRTGKRASRSPPTHASPSKRRAFADRLPDSGLEPPPIYPPQRSPRRRLPSAAAASSPAGRDSQLTHVTLSSNSSSDGAPAHEDDDLLSRHGGTSEALDPTLAAIRSSLATQAWKPAPALASSPSPRKASAGASRSGAGAAAAGKEDEERVTIRLKMVFDPTRTVPEIAKRAYEREEVFEIGLHESFSSLFYDLSVRRTIPRADIVVTHVRSASQPTKQTQVYEFGTPASLSLAAGAEATMRGYTRDVWNKVRDLERKGRLSGPSDAGAPQERDEDAELERAAAEAAARRAAQSAANSSKAIELDDDDDEDTLGPAALDAAAGGSESGAPFPLTLRGSRTQALSLAVKPSTSMAQLVKAYCKRFSITDAARQARMWIEFEGDRLVATRTVEDVKEEFDLEGEETFEVKE
ncbi:uncharacterized protein JCM10292_006664 [Rhodotorula paludigena]|uniref:uncharacterized protein n=1 Tax=Rhodotorula paludigena TaxID=86838 RepID=UPI003173248F